MIVAAILMSYEVEFAAHEENRSTWEPSFRQIMAELDTTVRYD